MCDPTNWDMCDPTPEKMDLSVDTEPTTDSVEMLCELSEPVEILCELSEPVELLCELSELDVVEMANEHEHSNRETCDEELREQQQHVYRNNPCRSCEKQLNGDDYTFCSIKCSWDHELYHQAIFGY